MPDTPTSSPAELPIAPSAGPCGCEAIELIGQFMAEHVDIVNATGALRQAFRRGDVAAARPLSRPQIWG